MPSLSRDRDGEGHYGSDVRAIDPETGKQIGNYPQVGAALYIGTFTAGMFSSRDWWLTTPITEITLDDDKVVKFNTKNSSYTLYK